MKKSDYINNEGYVIRTKIARDVRDLKLTKSDIENLSADPNINKSFWGDGYKNKLPKENWNKDYLETLTAAALDECFNKEYLLYLYEVAQYVSPRGRINGATCEEGLKPATKCIASTAVGGVIGGAAGAVISSSIVGSVAGTVIGAICGITLFSIYRRISK